MELLCSTLMLDKIFGISSNVNIEDFMALVVRFSFNLAVAVIIVKYIYFKNSKRRDYLFTFLLFSVIIFFLCYLLSNVKLGLGFALGLFAIFGILRYRTDTIKIKEMTYLFIIIGISVINALANDKVSYAELLFTNAALIGVSYVLEHGWKGRHEIMKSINYEKMHLIKPENHNQLMADLRDRTGLNIHRFTIGEMDFLRDTAQVTIYFYEGDNTASVYEEELS